MENIEKIHQYLIQFMLRNGVSTVQRAIKYCSKLENETVDMAKLGVIINHINRVICNQHFKLVFGTCEVTNKDLLVWLNLKNDPLSKSQPYFTERELEYFQAILEEIINSEQRKLMIVVCINITSTLTASFSRENGKSVLEKWIKSGYFVKNGEFIHLGLKLILEFTSYLRTHRPECVCYLCSELSFTGKICDNCDKMFHSYCIDKYMQNQTACPNCKQDWRETDVFKTLVEQSSTQMQITNIEEMNIDEGIIEPGPSWRGNRRNRSPCY
ncbi:hypothetical protein HHI36_000793 [Cryptolaemus montrouzieri]|uniref:Non-structural maintenance of chromosomes element 1 homolog n=1 Tax=Cryptolaemus montrouzieri TaxID=559131 RepID=A0ABD2P639_9CUCU